MGEHEGRPALGPWQRVLLAIGGLAIAAYATAADYQTVAHLAAHLNVALAWLAPLGIQGGLYVVMGLDLVLVYTERTVWWLRWAVLTFAAGVVAVNAAAGWPDYRGMGIRMFAPALLVIFVEAARHAMLRRQNEARRAARALDRSRRRAERIPWQRWLVDRPGTWYIKRRMIMWGVTSYTTAVSLEIDRRAAVERLRARFGTGWRDHVPGDLLWQLDTGVRITGALGRVDELLTAAAPLPAGVAPGVALSASLPVAPFMALTMAPAHGPDEAPNGPETGPADGPETWATGGPADGPDTRPNDGPDEPERTTGPDQVHPDVALSGRGRMSMDPDAVAARDEYIASLAPGRKTLTDRDLSALHPGRSRNWGKTRIEEVKRARGLRAVNS
jgi:hypothetical protein